MKTALSERARYDAQIADRRKAFTDQTKFAPIPITTKDRRCNRARRHRDSTTSTHTKMITTIGKTAAATLSKLVDRALNGGGDSDTPHVRIGKAGGSFMPVTVERVNTFQWSDGNGLELWSVAHYYTQNGDAMRDPEVVYAVPIVHGIRQFLFAYPQEWTQDGMENGYAELVELGPTGKPVAWMPKRQPDVAGFTTMWMKNIRQQQGL